MHIRPLLIKNKIVELGYRGHSRWGIKSPGCSAELQPEIVDRDFHCFATFQVRQAVGEYKPRIKSTLTRTSIVTPYESFHDCAPLPNGIIGRWRMILSALGNPSNFPLATSIESCVPYPPEFFYTDFASWKVVEENLFPVPEAKRVEAIKAVYQYLRDLQTVLNAHLLYWDTEGRPPLIHRSPDEVMAKYGKLAEEM